MPRRKAKNAPKSAPKTNKKKKNKISNEVGRMVGSTLGAKFGPMGSKIGGSIGNLAGGFFSKIFGKGDYSVEPEKNSLVHQRLSDSVPMFGTEDGAIRVRHREFLGDLSGNSVYRVVPLVITPMNYDVFPWLSTFAQNFEQYRIMGLVFEFKSTSGAFGIVSPALGSVMMATQYNVRQAPFGSKVALLNHFFAESSSPSSSFIHPVECKDAWDPLKVYNIRTGRESAGFPSDARFEDYAVLNVAMQGMPSAYVIGELWVSYDILLIKPRVRAGATAFVVDPLPPGPDDATVVTHIKEWPECCPPEEKDEELPPPPLLSRQNAVWVGVAASAMKETR